jgi:hypothetical protein
LFAVLPPELVLVAVDAGWVAALVAAAVATDVDVLVASDVAATVGAAGIAVEAAAAAVDGRWLTLVVVDLSDEPPPQAAKVNVEARRSGARRRMTRDEGSVDRCIVAPLYHSIYPNTLWVESLRE